MPKAKFIKLTLYPVPQYVKVGNAGVVAVGWQAVHPLVHGLPTVRSWAGELAGAPCVLLKTGSTVAVEAARQHSGILEGGVTQGTAKGGVWGGGREGVRGAIWQALFGEPSRHFYEQVELSLQWPENSPRSQYTGYLLQFSHLYLHFRILK